MENRIIYSTSEPLTILAFQNRPCSLKRTDPNFVQPSPADVKNLRKLLGLSQVALAKFLGVTYNPTKGSTTVRKWETQEDKKEHRPINYAAWRLLLVAANVVSYEEVQNEVNTLTGGSYTITRN